MVTQASTLKEVGGNKIDAISIEPVFAQEGKMMKAVVYLELAGRGGETAATHVKNVIFQQL